jgi:hypothetical protein
MILMPTAPRRMAFCIARFMARRNMMRFSSCCEIESAISCDHLCQFAQQTLVLSFEAITLLSDPPELLYQVFPVHRGRMFLISRVNRSETPIERF